MRRFFWIRLILFLWQSRWGFALIGLWFALGTVVFHLWEHLPLGESFLNAIYFRSRPDSFWVLYSFWGQCVLFGIVISIFLLQAFERYNPQEGRRMLAKEMQTMSSSSAIRTSACALSSISAARNSLTS